MIRIVIADDHAVFRSGLEALLEREPDLEVCGQAGTGPEAVQVALAVAPDVLLLDLGLPELPGARVAEQVLAERPALAIVVLTMHEDAYYLRELLTIGAAAFVLKKSAGTDLLRAIRTVAKGGRYVDPAMSDAAFGGRAPGPTSGAELLTAREREVCGALALGHTNAEVAQQLFISVRTVESHRTHIMGKLELRSRAGLVRFAIRHGLVKLTE